jgi:hypothetical protein
MTDRQPMATDLARISAASDRAHGLATESSPDLRPAVDEGDDYAPFQRCTRTANDGFRCHRESGHAGHCRSMEQS